MRNFELKTKHASWLTVIWVIACLLTVFDTKAQTVADANFCELFAVSAAVTMKARQEGVPVEEQLAHARETGSAIERMIYDAYEVPVVKGRQNKAYEVSKFETRYYVACLNYMVRK
ncbi:hypothetical protein Bhz55_00082 [Stenotrophomonas phage vB_SmaS_Bhz55]